MCSWTLTNILSGDWRSIKISQMMRLRKSAWSWVMKQRKLLRSMESKLLCLFTPGEGVQPIIKLSQPVDKGEIEELNLRVIGLVESELGINIDHATDCSRILRLPGFLNVKDAERPLPTELIELNPNNITDPKDIRKLPLPKKKSTQVTKQPAGYANDLGIPLDTIRQVDGKLDELLKGPEQLGYPSLSEADQAAIAKLWLEIQ